MSKPDRLAYVVIGLSIALGFILGGRTGIICGVVGVLAGAGLLAWIITSSAKHEDSSEVGSVAAYSAHEETKILMLVRDAHARALPENDSDFDIFLNVWVTSETEFDVGIREFQLTLTGSDGSARPGERITGDLEKWRVGKEREESDMWDTYVQTSRENLSELNTAEPLLVGIPREGWLHFRLRNLVPEEFRTRPMGLSLVDSLSHVHVGLLRASFNFPEKCGLAVVAWHRSEDFGSCRSFRPRRGNPKQLAACRAKPDSEVRLQ